MVVVIVSFCPSSEIIARLFADISAICLYVVYSGWWQGQMVDRRFLAERMIGDI